MRLFRLLCCIFKLTSFWQNVITRAEGAELMFRLYVFLFFIFVRVEMWCACVTGDWMKYLSSVPYTVEPRLNEPLFNELLGITNNIFRPGKSYSKMSGTEPRFNESRFNELLDLTNQSRQPKVKIYLKLPLYNEQRSSQVMNTVVARHSHRLIKVRQVNSYIIQFLNRKFSLVLWNWCLKANLHFTSI